MNYDNKTIAGLLFFVGVVQFVLAIVISEAIYSGYSVGQQAVSDLGNWSKAGNSAPIFDASVILLGTSVIAGAYFIQRAFKNRRFTSLLVVGGVAIVGLGVFAENVFLPAHMIFSLVTFVFAATSAIMSSKFEKSPLSHVSVILGLVTVLAIFLSTFGFYFGIGYGGMERLVIYPSLLWLLGFGAYLIGESTNTALTSKT